LLVHIGYTESGRLGIGPYNPKYPYVVTPQLILGLSNIIKVLFFYIYIKDLYSYLQFIIIFVKVAVNSGGRHCLALSSSGEVYAWGDGDDGKLGLGNRV
jgi:hypothetical protein